MPCESLNVHVPVPIVTVPLFVIKPAPVVGLLPSGMVHAEPMVIGPFKVLLNATRLKVMDAQARVLAPVVPSNVTVPLLALKVGEPVTVKLLSIVIVPEVEVNVPPLRLNEPFRSMVWVAPVNVPVACVKPEDPIVKLRACVIVPLYPVAILMPATEPAKLPSIVASLVEVELKVATSEEVGQVSGPSQLAQVLQLLSPPPPSQVLVAACEAFGRNKNTTANNKQEININFFVFICIFYGLTSGGVVSAGG